MKTKTLDNFIEKYSKIDLSEYGIANRHLGNIVSIAKELKAWKSNDRYRSCVTTTQEMKIAIPGKGCDGDSKILREIILEVIKYREIESEDDK